MNFVSEPDKMFPRIDVIIGTSCDEMMQHSFLKSGADSFIPKPFESLIECQQKILGLLPDFQEETGLSIVQNDAISPDALTYSEDFCRVI